ncbi:MAG TPA: hypothetical protein VI997_00855 [Candidatus Thermoplasmatota archaeon]|nr:hypothetical protein [Candidatus Thermoplasmatota archaeon]
MDAKVWIAVALVAAAGTASASGAVDAELLADATAYGNAALGQGANAQPDELLDEARTDLKCAMDPAQQAELADAAVAEVGEDVDVETHAATAAATTFDVRCAEDAVFRVVELVPDGSLANACLPSAGSQARGYLRPVEIQGPLPASAYAEAVGTMDANLGPVCPAWPTYRIEGAQAIVTQGVATLPEPADVAASADAELHAQTGETKNTILTWKERAVGAFQAAFDAVTGAKADAEARADASIAASQGAAAAATGLAQRSAFDAGAQATAQAYASTDAAERAAVHARGAVDAAYGAIPQPASLAAEARGNVAAQASALTAAAATAAVDLPQGAPALPAVPVEAPQPWDFGPFVEGQAATSLTSSATSSLYGAGALSGSASSTATGAGCVAASLPRYANAVGGVAPRAC